ncbi:MAG: phosphomannose isomerase type II C-terminal cupin domain [Patescibacteria group bacterium]|nr:phosphomannose isomerase type II C-terminal cupin domain [Patescibacteria group bacterium]MDE1944490.1 phosphomannose isomerase type II C-terminal cupin domain [Patescibacteria group bacterium]MDE1944984.1 phosphomannose isomerase type II C-terminal cupin domain [Patescibacteria group bacterium]MDE2057407.1 phosphomannose isomerase type II C-terminal cupin domain [Patescibacteria group bacterium]
MEGLANYEREERPWGSFERFTLNESSTVKVIAVEAGQAFSLQTHAHRSEFWRILEGRGRVTVGSETREARAGDTFYVRPGIEHRVEADAERIVFLEIAFGPFDEADIARLEDRYGRA